ncbi:MAG: Holliday junction branch migration protein RuvA [Tannerella sp.]|jgi:Holliday junction DNA helicase RuvA|nr:Holliday junction branch migration protein RuvA [Tannerella sp.]
MIDYIRGTIAELSPAQMIMECGGIGYELSISVTTYSAFNGMSEGKIFVIEVIREDAHLLYGFATKEERELFELLTSVSGVGPNTARMILSSLKPSDLINVIASGDDVSLTTIKGIGSKTAQRIIVDLKKKVRTVESLADESGAFASSGVNAEVADGAISALVMLGFQKNMSQKVVMQILKKSPGMSVEQVIKEGLRIL